MDAMVEASGAAPRDAIGDRVVRPLRWALRAVITLHAVDVFLQPVFAGRFLSGDYGMLGAHGNNAFAVVIIALVQTVLAVVYWRPGGGPGWPALASVGLLVAESVQMELGFARVIGVHVPLGVAIVAAAILMLVWAWGHSFGGRRGAGRGAV